MSTVPEAAQPLVADAAAAHRPTRALPFAHLLELSVYWLGINAIWAGLHDVILPRRLEELVGILDAGKAIGLVTTAGVVMAILVQPTAGAISDYTTSRWGRRKPYIAIGATLDVVFLAGIATSNTLVAILAFMVLLQFSSNLAQGPFQGYVPDLVPAPQVGLASGLMGVMIVLGQVVGVGIGTIGLVTEQFVIATIALGVVQLLAAVVLLATVDEGRAATSRQGRSWARIAASTWGTDILRERGFVWLIASRLCFLAAPAIITGFALYYLERSMGMGDAETGTWLLVILGVVGATTALTTYPAARLSDRFGRKPVIYASCLVGALGTIGVILAPTIQIALAALVPVGVAIGAFLAVDWALMTDIIPKATSGRYMGISNVATASAGPLGILAGGVVLDAVTRTDVAAGPRMAYVVTLVFYALGALFLAPVDARRRDD
jgi:MFS family permease